MPAIMIAADGDNGRRRRAGHGREQRAREQRRHREPAAKVADERVRERDHAFRDAARRHERAGEDEERDREQRIDSAAR